MLTEKIKQMLEDHKDELPEIVRDDYNNNQRYVICINQLIELNKIKGHKCYGCKPDTNPDHAPNNTTCPSYRPVPLGYFNVKENV
jgi:hypothetical protein